MSSRSLATAHKHCRDAPTAAANPLVAFCLTGALRSFAEPRIYGSIKENLIDSFSNRGRVFVVSSFDCRIGTDTVLGKDAQTAKCAAEYTTQEVDKALAYIGAEAFELMPNRAPTPVVCPAAADVERHPSFWYQQTKTQRCFEHVQRYEQEHNICFDWVVRARPDDVWKTPTPPATVLPRDVITTGGVWEFLVRLADWQNNFTAIEDHFMAVPRMYAGVAFSAVRSWFDCRPTAAYRTVCPPHMLHFDGRKAPLMQSECLLGLHLRERGVRWHVDKRFSYMTRRVPERFNSNSTYTRMMNTLEHIPGRWDDAGKFTRFSPHAKEELRDFYDRREHAARAHRWGEDPHEPDRPAVASGLAKPCLVSSY